MKRHCTVLDAQCAEIKFKIWFKFDVLMMRSLGVDEIVQVIVASIWITFLTITPVSQRHPLHDIFKFFPENVFFSSDNEILNCVGPPILEFFPKK